MSLENLFGGKKPMGTTTGRIVSDTPSITEITRQQPTAGGTFGYLVQKAKADLRQATDRYNKRVGERDLLIKQRDEAVIKRLEAERQLGIYDRVQLLLQKTSDFARQQVKGRIEAMITNALNVTFGPGHNYFMKLEVRSNRPEADHYLSENGVLTKLEKPDYDRGGGKVDIICLAWHLILAELEKVEGPLLLDEVGKHVDGEAVHNAAYFLKEYAQQFNREIILITHNETLAAIGDRAIKFKKIGNKAQVVTA
jgi:DNA repair exonuclease SbcCD ATPase subunit